MTSPVLFLAIAINAWTAAEPRQTPVEAGKSLFTERCAVCHGVNGTGGTLAQSILPRLAALDDTALATAIRDGVPTKGMPAFALPQSEMTAVVAYLRTLRPPAAGRGRAERSEEHTLER